MTENLLKKNRKKKGFTLIELIVVIAIIAIMALVAIPKFLGYQENARRKSDIANAKSIATAAATLVANGGITPTGQDISIGTTSNDSGTDGAKIQSSLQSTPKPQAKNSENSIPSNFLVHIDTSGNITITTKSGSANDALYPSPGSTYTTD